MGEVVRPSTFQVAGEKINVLEAIGMAGDLTVFAKRSNVKVIRKAADKVEVAHLNLNNSSVMRSPFYNLRQNDVVLVEPGKRKGLQAEGLNIIVPAATSMLSLIIVALTRFH
jgi:polysaccharide export outer membrane protein